MLKCAWNFDFRRQSNRTAQTMATLAQNGFWHRSPDSVRHVFRLQINLMSVILPLSGKFLKFHQKSVAYSLESSTLPPSQTLPQTNPTWNICCSGELAALRYFLSPSFSFSPSSTLFFASKRNTFECKFQTRCMSMNSESCAGASTGG